ncbi:hypothetical protein [Nocardioides sp.]|uniref:hypothetical protein n=1 Tax=Nocardioides sp. TaxID=35761 RepID=UPI00271E6AD6|nr:hypothetical protein [Nocardioides sp.]MDO9458275.1 hypothetical protein [Nocardioides sp.]
MPLRRSAAVLLALLTLLSAGALAGCSDDDGGASTPSAEVTPTAVGDRALVEVLDPGADARRVLSLGLADGTTTDATLVISQEVVADDEPTVVPPVTVPFALGVTAGDGDEVTTTQTYAAPTVDPTGAMPAAVARVEDAIGPIAGTTSQLVVRPDGTVVEATSGVDAAAQFDAQLRALVPVLPTTEVGVGARWSSTSVAEVGGALVDQVATYTLESLEDDTYGISVTIEQTYRPGPVGDVEVRSGLGTVSARLDGTLGRLLPDRATGNVSTQVSYVVGGEVTEVRTTVALALTAS